MQTPRLPKAKLIAREDLPPPCSGCSIEVWESHKGYYVYYRYSDRDYLTLLRGPFKRKDYALKMAEQDAKALCRRLLLEEDTNA